MSAPRQHEQRKYRRYRIRRKAILMTDEHAPFHLEARDISARGITLIADAVLTPSRQYKISLGLGDDPLDLEKGRYVEFTAQLVNTGTIELQSRYRYGFMIVGIEPHFDRVLTEFVEYRRRLSGDMTDAGCERDSEHADTPEPTGATVP